MIDGARIALRRTKGMGHNRVVIRDGIIRKASFVKAQIAESRDQISVALRGYGEDEFQTAAALIGRPGQFRDILQA